MALNDPIKLLSKSGWFTQVAFLPVADLPFDAGALAACRANACGNYGRCWTCPPLVGTPDALRARLLQFSRMVVFSRMYRLEDSYDYEGMEAGNRDFDRLTDRAEEILRAARPEMPLLLLGAGGCRRCVRCAALDNLPCRLPDRARLSLEACCIQVAQLCGRCGMRYTGDPDTVTYFGVVLY